MIESLDVSLDRVFPFCGRSHLATLTLFSVPSEVSSAKSGDSITITPGTWLGVPGLPSAVSLTFTSCGHCGHFTSCGHVWVCTVKPVFKDHPENKARVFLVWSGVPVHGNMKGKGFRKKWSYKRGSCTWKYEGENFRGKKVLKEGFLYMEI